MSALANKLREARALIQRGWTQEEYFDVDGLTDCPCYCATGAIGLATVNDVRAGDDDVDDQKPDFRQAIAALGAAVGVEHSHEIARWNDYPTRTQAEVLAAFDKAISLAEQVQS